MPGIWLLTDAQIESATKSVCDGGNLWLMVKPAKDGGLWKSWSFLYACPATGRRREMGLGSLKAVSAERARALAKQAHDWLSGMPPKDPITQRRAEKERTATLTGITVDDVIDEYIEMVLPSYPEESQVYIRTQLKRISKVGKYAPKDVTPLMLRDKTGYGELYLTNYPTSKKLRSIMKAVFARAKAAGLCPTNPAEKGDLDVLLPRRTKKHKVVSHPSVKREDMYQLITALRAHTDGRKKTPSRLSSVYACEMLALTGIRVSEVIEATWSEIDFDNKRWTVPWQHLKIKDDEIDRPIPITSSMLAILLAMKERGGDKTGPGDLIFRGQSKDGFYSHQALGQVFKRVGWPDKVDNHGFRTTLRGWGKNSNHGEPHLIEIQLHHVQRGTAKAYSAQDDDWGARTKMMQHYNDYCNTSPISK
jgi:integrase